MIVLAIETSSTSASVAVLSDARGPAGAPPAAAGDRDVRVELAERSRGRQGEVLLPLVARALEAAGLAPADVGLVAVGIGPGGFTSLRVGLATAKGLALAHGAALVGVPSARVIARALAPRGAAAVFTDAQRGEVYASAYRFDGERPVELVAPFLASPDVAAAAVREATAGLALTLGGDGLVAHRAALLVGLGVAESAIAPEVLFVPRAAVLGTEALDELARRGPDDLGALEPLYVRPSDAKLPAKPLRLGR